MEQQARWYSGELERFEKDERLAYVMVCCHEPPYTNSKVVKANKKVKALFADPFVQFRKTRLFLSGHSHTYERFEGEGKFFVVSGGGGGPRHKVNVDPMKRSYNDLFPGSELRFLHFCEIEECNGNLILKVIRLEADGSFAVADSAEFETISKKGKKNTGAPAESARTH